MAEVDHKDPMAGLDEPNPDNVEAVVEQPVDTETPEFKFGDLPFKSLEEAVAGHKNLQRQFSADREKLKRLDKLEQILPQLLSRLKGTPEAELEDPEETIKAWLTSPGKVMSSIVKRELDRLFPERMKPYEQKINDFEVDRELSNFKNAHPEYNDELEAQLESVFDANPDFFGYKNRLERAYESIIARDPEAHLARIKASKAVIERDTEAARGAAGLGGKKSSTSTVRKPTDEFDDVLSYAAGLQQAYK